MSDMKNDYEQIYLEPIGGPFDEEGRTWCQDNVYDPDAYAGDEAIKYIRVDLYEQQAEKIAGLEKANENLMREIHYANNDEVIDLRKKAGALRAENEGLKKAIADHNQDLEAICAVMHTERSDMCHHYESRGRNCCDCPKDYAIKLSGEGE